MQGRNACCDNIPTRPPHRPSPKAPRRRRGGRLTIASKSTHQPPTPPLENCPPPWSLVLGHWSLVLGHCVIGHCVISPSPPLPLTPTIPTGDDRRLPTPPALASIASKILPTPSATQYLTLYLPTTNRDLLQFLPNMVEDCQPITLILCTHLGHLPPPLSPPPFPRSPLLPPPVQSFKDAYRTCTDQSHRRRPRRQPPETPGLRCRRQKTPCPARRLPRAFHHRIPPQGPPPQAQRH